MKKIIFIVPYFGPFPNYFDLFLKSCSYHPTIDWLFITDQDFESPYPNIHIARQSFEDLKSHIEKIIHIRATIPGPYKLCDYRPAFGHIFAEYIKGYDFWGHCDIDVIYGDLTTYLDQVPWDAYDRIFTFGHMTLYRNNEKVNHYYQLSGHKETDFYYCIRQKEPMYFDEMGMNKLLETHHIPQYDFPTFADIWPQSITFKNRLFYRDKNYKNQYFIWYQGQLFKIWHNNEVIRKREYSYLHLQKRTFPNPSDHLIDEEGFVMTPHGFYSLHHPDLVDLMKPNFKHVANYFWKRYRDVTPKKMYRKIKITLQKESQK